MSKNPSSSADSPPSLQFMPTGGKAELTLHENEILILQQLLANERRSLSVEELEFRNPNLDYDDIHYYIEELEEQGVVQRLIIPEEVSGANIPNKFYEVTEEGEELLKNSNLYDEISLWKQIYDHMERTKRIQNIEKIERSLMSEAESDSNKEELPYQTPEGVTGPQDSTESKIDRLEEFLMKKVEDQGELYFKSKFISDEVDIEPKEIGALMIELQEESELNIERWSYTGATTWRVEQKG